MYEGLPGSSADKESACNAGDLDLILELGRSPGGGHSNPLQNSCLESPVNRGAWWATSMGSQRVRHIQHSTAMYECSSR